MIVIETSALLEWLLHTPRAAAVERHLLGSGGWCAPHLLDLEVVEVLHFYTTSGEITAQRAEEALHDLKQLRIQRYGHDPLLGRIWELRQSLGASEAVFLAMAESRDALLLTCDPAFKEAAGHRARVELV